MTDYLIAVDAGGTTTRAIVVSTSECVLGSGSAGCGNHASAGLDAAVAEVLKAIDQATTSGGVSDTPASCACLAISGADYPEDFEMLADAYGPRVSAARLLIENDAIAALRANSSRPYGVAVVFGTGANCAGISKAGVRERHLSQGYLFGDYGAAVWIGTEAMHRAYRAWDGRGPATALVDVVRRHFGEDDLYELSKAIVWKSIAPQKIWLLAPLVFEAAAAGDSEAAAIVDLVAAEAAACAVNMMRRVDLLDDAVDVVLAGSVFKEKDDLVASIQAAVAAANPLATVILPGAPPVAGAALIALESLGSAVSEQVRHSLLRSIPPGLE